MQFHPCELWLGCTSVHTSASGRNPLPEKHFGGEPYLVQQESVSHTFKRTHIPGHFLPLDGVRSLARHPGASSSSVPAPGRQAVWPAQRSQGGVGVNGLATPASSYSGSLGGEGLVGEHLALSLPPRIWCAPSMPLRIARATRPCSRQSVLSSTKKGLHYHNPQLSFQGDDRVGSKGTVVTNTAPVSVCSLFRSCIQSSGTHLL